MRSPGCPRLPGSVRTIRSAGRASELIGAMPGVARVYCGWRAGGDRPRSSSGRETWWSCRRPIHGLPIRTGLTIAWRPISLARSTFTANPAMTLASCSSTRSCSGRQAERSAKLARKKLGFRALFDVVPLDPVSGARKPRHSGDRSRRQAGVDRRWPGPDASRRDSHDGSSRSLVVCTQS